MYSIYYALLLHYGAPLCLFIKIEHVCRVERRFDVVVNILLMLDIKVSAAQRMVFNQLFFYCRYKMLQWRFRIFCSGWRTQT